MSIDAIKEAVAAKLKQAEAKRREADLLEAEVRGLNTALSMLLPMVAANVAAVTSVVARRDNLNIVESGAKVVRSLGRQPGALSNRWKERLLELREIGDTFSDDDVGRVVQLREGRSMRPSEIRRLFEKWAPYGHVRVHDGGRYSVPSQAADRFRATLKAGADADVVEGEDDQIHDLTINENEAPEGASELVGVMR